MTIRIAIDVGGTFTDVIVMDGHHMVGFRKLATDLLEKVRLPTQSSEPGLMGGLLLDASTPASLVGEVLHASTVATNTIIQGKGATTALVTTEGFRDVLEIARIRVPVLYDLFYRRPPPLVPRDLRYEIGERMTSSGSVIRDLDVGRLDQIGKELIARRVEAVAVSLINSYVNPMHERLVAERLREELPDVPITEGAAIVGLIGEYERTSTAVINAYVSPSVRAYLSDLETRLREEGVVAPILVMQSSGATVPLGSAIDRPAYLVESGPAAGLTAVASLAKSCELGNVISFDMGGTTAKAALIEEGQLPLTADYEVGGGISLSRTLVQGGGYSLSLPVVDISEVGAGGGSVATVDALGKLTVGPESSGAYPGPACYGRGGILPTVTDANVALGFINPKSIGVGAISINRERACRSIEEHVAEPLGISVDEAAFSIHSIATASMTRAVRAVTTYRGRDPRQLSIVAFGGSGPIHAVGVAQALRVSRVIVPRMAGVLSAIGLLLASIEHHFVRSVLTPIDIRSAVTLAEHFAILLRQAQEELSDLAYAEEDLLLHRSLDLRYKDQGHSLNIVLAKWPLTPDVVHATVEDFHSLHRQTYGHNAPDETVEVVNARMAISPPAKPSPLSLDADGSVDSQLDRSRRAYFGKSSGRSVVQTIARKGLNDPVSGPVLIDELDSTTLVPHGWQVVRDPFDNLVITPERHR